jgi:glycosyltransferase involved in cell wall biosynthesis
LLFGHSQLFNFIILYFVNKRAKKSVPLIWEANAIWGIHKVRSVKGYIVNRLNKYIQKKVFFLADHIISQTDASKNFICDFYKVPSEKVLIIKNAINPEPPLLKRSGVTRQYSKFVKVLCVGLFDEMNGIPFLLDFLKSHQYSKIQFFFIGDGKFSRHVEELANGGLCTYFGSLPHQQMLTEYEYYDYLIVPRLKQKEAELFIPTKLIEAMYYGLIPICSKVNAMEEIVQDGATGFLFEPGNQDSLHNVLKKITTLPRSEREKISSRAITRIISDYNWADNYVKINELYEDCQSDPR